MGIILLFLIILAILAAIVFFKLFKNTFKAISLIFFTALFILVILVALFIMDMQVFKDSFADNHTIYLLDNEGELQAGFGLLGFNFSTFIPIPTEDLEAYLAEDSDRIRVVVKRSALDDSLQSNLTQGYSLAQAVDSPDYQLRSAGFMVGVGAMIRKDSPTQLFRLVRTGDVAVFPESFVIKVLTFDSKNYKEELKEQYKVQKESVLDTLGVRKQTEVNESELSE